LKVIDALGRGFHTVYRHWWLILIPVMLDTFLWVGPQSSIETLVQRTFQVWETELASASTEDFSEELATVRETLDGALTGYNSFAPMRVTLLGVPSLLTWGGARLGSPSIYEVIWVMFLGAIGMPELLVSVSGADFLGVPVWQIEHEGSWLLVSLLSSTVGIAVGSIYLTTISRAVTDPESPWPFWPRALRLAVRIVLLWLLRGALLIVIGIPLALMLIGLSMLSPGLAMLVGTIVVGVAVWVSFYCVFIVASLAMTSTSLWRAVWNSFGVVLRNFWATLWLFLLINLIGGGLTILWQQLSTGSWWTWMAIIGHAYVGTSLVTASFLFYQDRYARWQRALAALISRKDGERV
jgi:hypothetical protein